MIFVVKQMGFVESNFCVIQTLCSVHPDPNGQYCVRHVKSTLLWSFQTFTVSMLTLCMYRKGCSTHDAYRCLAFCHTLAIVRAFFYMHSMYLNYQSTYQHEPTSPVPLAYNGNYFPGTKAQDKDIRTRIPVPTPSAPAAPILASRARPTKAPTKRVTAAINL